MVDRRFRASSFALGLLVSGLLLLSAVGGALADRVFVIKPLDRWWPRGGQPVASQILNAPQSAEPAIAVAEKSRDAVVTVAAKRPVARRNLLPFGLPAESPETELVQQDIGTGFSVSMSDGLIVTNRHVVADPQLEYKIIDVNGQEYEVQKIYRDPTNDLAILQTTAHLPALALADSDQLKVGQTVIAIGTSLGEFRQSVTTGVVSGLGRGIDASDGFQAEHIDGLIQTDAAINPGNSGGPLLDVKGETVGVNVAMADAENIGFAIPINIVKASINNFNDTGRFDRPLLGVQYKLIPRETALLNDVPEGAYVVAIIAGTTAEKMGLQVGDILIKVDGRNTKDETGGLAGLINSKKIGDTVSIELWRNGQVQTLSGALLVAPS